MQLCTTLPPRLELAPAAERAVELERLGFDVIQVAETVHDSLLTALVVLQSTSTVIVRTSMTVAFPRSPMVTALAARDLMAYAGARFELGLASQVRGNIVDRYSARWDRPVAQLEDYLAAVRASFDAFAGNPLQHEGSHYRLHRMQPYFRPDPAPCPSLWMGAVGPSMCRLAARSADGLVAHPTGSHPLMLRNRIWPMLRRGCTNRPADLGPRPRLVANPMVVLSDDDTELERVRRELAFVLTTPAYRGILDELGESERADALAAAAGSRDWARVDTLIDTALVRRLVPVTSTGDLSEALAERFESLVDGLVLPAPPGASAQFTAALEQVRGLATAADPAP